MLTTLGVIIGSACIVLVVTAALTGKRYVVSQIEGVGANLVYGQVVQSRVERLADEITPADLEAIKVGVPHVMETAGTSDNPMTMAVNGIGHPISGVGALLGIAIAVSIPAVINYSVRYFPADGDLHAPISWMSVVLSFVVSCSNGLVFGYLPANRAARLQPTESLRRE
jgi:ABC-type antimicrobial peptide transport system permease subunit